MRRAILVLVFLASLSLMPEAHSAKPFATDVFGTYVGFTSGASKSSFRLRFTPSLRLSYSYRLRGVSVRETYRAHGTGRFTGIAKARGRTIGVASGSWTNTARSIRASGRLTLPSGGSHRFSSRIKFGPGTVSVVTRAGGSAVRASGVKR